MSTAPGIVFDERHKLDPDRAHNRESLVWVVPLLEEQLGLIAYTWVDAHGAAGAFAVAFGPRLDEAVFERVDDRPVDPEMTFADWRVGELEVGHDGERRDAHVRFAGERMRLEMEFQPIGVPYAYSSHPDPFPSYYADERLEQGGRVRGTLVLDGEEIALDALCHRDHSWGARHWGSVLHYKWFNFLTADASVHVMDLQGLGHRDLRGYVYRGGSLADVVDARFDYELDADFVHRRLETVLEDSAGRSTRCVLSAASAELTYPINDRLTLIDVVGPATIEGAEAAAYVEMSWPPEYIVEGIEVRE